LIVSRFRESATLAGISLAKKHVHASILEATHLDDRRELLRRKFRERTTLPATQNSIPWNGILLDTDQNPLNGKYLFAFELKIGQLKFDVLATLSAREWIAFKVH
jgi:hypothetical protein